METELPYKIDVHRKLCIKKDLIELSQWIDTLAVFNTELEQLKLIEKQLIRNSSIQTMLLAVRRKNTLILATLCKYEIELNNEYEYGSTIYDVTRAKEHEKKRDIYSGLMQDFFKLRKTIYDMLSKYQRK